jgi:hypothetical protein
MENQSGSLLPFDGRVDRIVKFRKLLDEACRRHGVLINGYAWEVEQFDESKPLTEPRDGADEEEIQRLQAFNLAVRVACLQSRFQMDVQFKTTKSAPAPDDLPLVHLCFIEPAANGSAEEDD